MSALLRTDVGLTEQDCKRERAGRGAMHMSQDQTPLSSSPSTRGLTHAGRQ